ncbi:MAG: hypothetical protein KGD63_06675 [Candidatus Lokiarchaeota archaeon]|nr:hypothetical protein [Candidatus Lokiarchaeota archaeon]
MNNQKNLWLEIPSHVFVTLARRGMDRISLDQCFLVDCDNNNKSLLETIKIKEYNEKYHHIKIIYMKCNKCNRNFQLKIDRLNYATKQNDKKENNISIGLVYARDNYGNNLGHVGYF